MASRFRPLVRPSRRLLSSVSTPGFQPRPRPATSNVGPKVGTLFTGLIALGVSVTAYGLYEYYSSFATWPAVLRDDLRAAIKSRNRGDARRAESFFRKALDKARQLDQEGKLGDAALLKVSGIEIALASLLEDEGQLQAAYDVHQEALESVRQKAKSGEERMRGVAIAQRMGDLAQLDGVASKGEITGTQQSTDDAEKALVWSVEELLRLAIPEEVRAKALAGEQQSVSLDAKAASVSDEDKITIADLKLPPWVSQQEIGASIEALGAFYASRGAAEYAVPLYLQALSILMPPKSSSRAAAPTVADRCRAAV